MRHRASRHVQAVRERRLRALVTAAQDDDAFIRAGGIAGLGNAQRRDDIPRLLTAIGDEDSRVRAEAVSSMRFWVEPNTTLALLDALTDENRVVASEALDVLRKQHFAGEADPALVERIRDGRYNLDIEEAIASSMVGDIEEPAARVALAVIKGRTKDHLLANRLAELL